MYFWRNPITLTMNMINSIRTQARREGYGEVFRQFKQMSHLKFNGQLVGVDATGNKYYEHIADLPHMTRWVVYSPSNGVEASSVPPQWQQWLHMVSDVNPATEPNLFVRYDWQLENQPAHLSNMGVGANYLPPKALLNMVQKPTAATTRATGLPKKKKYEAWGAQQDQASSDSY